MATDDTITTRELCSLAAITYRQADYWVRQGYLRVANPEAHGSGTRRRHPRREVEVAWGLSQLMSAGCLVGAQVADSLRSLPPGWDSNVLFDAEGFLTDDLDEARWVVQPQELSPSA